MGWILLAGIIAWFVIDIRRDAKKAREREAMEVAKMEAANNEEAYYLNAYLERKQREKEDREIELEIVTELDRETWFALARMRKEND